VSDSADTCSATLKCCPVIGLQITQTDLVSAWRALSATATFYSATCMVFTARRYGSAVCAVVVYLSVRPSVTLRYCTKRPNVQCRITQTKPYDSAAILVFWSETSRRNSDGVTPIGGAK